MTAFKFERGDEVTFRGRPAVVITWPEVSKATGEVVYGVRFLDVAAQGEEVAPGIRRPVPGSSAIARETELEWR